MRTLRRGTACANALIAACRRWAPWRVQAAGMAYGENPGGGRSGGMLVFDFELCNIT